MKNRYQERFDSWSQATAWAAAGESVRGNIMTDGTSELCYGDLPAVFQRFDQQLQERGVRSEHCLSLECPQSLGGALALLYLLDRGQSFVLLPQRGKRYRGSEESRFVPDFCRFGMRLPEQRETSRAVAAAAVVEIADNEQFTDEPETLGSPGPKLYLRTSGSIATPKIAVHSHAKLIGNAMNCVGRFAMTAGDRIAIPVPIFHMYGLGAAFLPALLAGAAVDLMANVNILRYLEREEKFNPNTAFLTPALCTMFLKTRKSPRSYKLVVTAGDRIRPEVVCEFEHRFGPLLNLYGSTELGAVAVSDPRREPAQRGASSGLPLADVAARLGAVQTQAPDGATGELYCKHEYGFDGYVDRAGRRWQQGTGCRDSWFRTGDLAKIRDDGTIEILGRCDHSVNRDGLLVLFADIESAMEGIDGVERVVVVGKGESRRGQRLVAFCLPKLGRELTAAGVRQASFERLPDHAVPDDVVVVESLPALPNGKVDRRAIARQVPLTKS